MGLIVSRGCALTSGSTAIREVMPMTGRARPAESMMGFVDDFLMWAGAGLLLLVIPWVFWDLLIYGVLTPTRKSPARPGDLENRRSFGGWLRVQVTVAAVGLAMLGAGLVLR